MLISIFSMFIKDLKVIAKDKTGMIGLFLMPLVLIIVMSLALQSLFEDDSSSSAKDLPIADLDGGPYAELIVSALEDFNGINVITSIDGKALTAEDVRRLVENRTFQTGLVFPEDFSERIADPDNTNANELRLLADAALPVQYIAPLEGMLNSLSREVVYRALNGGKNIPSISLRKENISGGDNYVDVDTYQQNVPGYAVLGVFMIVGTIAASIMREKQEGTFRRLRSTPVGKGATLIGKILPCLLINMLQLALMFGAARLIFGMGLGNIPALFVLGLALSAAATGLGMMVAALAKTDTQVGGTASLLTLTMSAIGGCFMPSSIMPDFLQKISLGIPHYWAMQGFQNVLARGYDIAGIAPQAAILSGFALVFFIVGVWRFRFE